MLFVVGDNTNNGEKQNQKLFTTEAQRAQRKTETSIAGLLEGR